MADKEPRKPGEKITKALARRLAQSKGKPVRAVVFAAIDADKLTLESFAARARQRDEAVRERLGAIMERVRAWEAAEGQSVEVEFRPNDAAVVVVGPAALVEALAGDEAVSVLDAE
jgi:pyruvoyl-dependent arginine decarboxylase (PvlArgDC)